MNTIVNENIIWLSLSECKVNEVSNNYKKRVRDYLYSIWCLFDLIERCGCHGVWDSHQRESNPWPHPYHGCALPAELWRHLLLCCSFLRIFELLHCCVSLGENSIHLCPKVQMTLQEICISRLLSDEVFDLKLSDIRWLSIEIINCLFLFNIFIWFAIFWPGSDIEREVQ